VFADPAELVGGGQAGNDRIVIDGAVAGETTIVRKNDMIAELAIMRDVAVAKE